MSPTSEYGTTDDTTTVTIRGRRFIVELYQNRRLALFRDSSRSYTSVAKVSLPDGVGKDPKKMDIYLRRAGRYIIKGYEDQYRREEYNVDFLPGHVLTEAERAAGLFKPLLFSELSEEEEPATKRKTRHK